MPIASDVQTGRAEFTAEDDVLLIPLRGCSSAMIQVRDGAVAPTGMTLEASVSLVGGDDAGNWAQIPFTPLTNPLGTPVDEITAAGIWIINLPSAGSVLKIECTALVSGSAKIEVLASPAITGIIAEILANITPSSPLPVRAFDGNPAAAGTLKYQVITLSTADVVTTQNIPNAAKAIKLTALGPGNLSYAIGENPATQASASTSSTSGGTPAVGNWVQSGTQDFLELEDGSSRTIRLVATVTACVVIVNFY